MKYYSLGNARAQASRVGFGVWTVSTTMWGIEDEAVGVRLLQKAFDLGITLYDTADVYGDGRGETMLAEALGSRRDEIVIATKFGYDFINHPGIQPGQRERPHDWSPAFVRKACEESLRRLQTDHIDLYQLHNPRMDALQNDALWETLTALQAEGKIGTIGAALGPALKPDRQSEEGVYVIEHRRAAPQIIYNLFEQMLGEAIFPTALQAGIPVFTRVPHASDLLLGHITEDTVFAPNDHRAHRVPTDEAKKRWQLDGLKKLDKIQFLLADGKRTIGQAAIQFILSEPCIGSVFPNIYDEPLLAELAAASDTPVLTAEELAKIHDLYTHDFYLEPETAAV